MTLRVQPAPMLRADRVHGVPTRMQNASLHSLRSAAVDGASDDGKSGIMLSTVHGSSMHGGHRGLGGDMREDAVDVDTLDPVRNPRPSPLLLLVYTSLCAACSLLLYFIFSIARRAVCLDDVDVRCLLPVACVWSGRAACTLTSSASDEQLVAVTCHICHIRCVLSTSLRLHARCDR